MPQKSGARALLRQSRLKIRWCGKRFFFFFSSSDASSKQQGWNQQCLVKALALVFWFSFFGFYRFEKHVLLKVCEIVRKMFVTRYLNFREPHYAKIATNSRLFCWPSSCTRQVEMKLTTSSSSSLERNTKAKETISKSKTSNSRTILHFRVPTLHRTLNGLNAARHPRRRPTQRAEINNIIFTCGETSFSTWRLFALWRKENLRCSD